MSVPLSARMLELRSRALEQETRSMLLGLSPASSVVTESQLSQADLALSETQDSPRPTNRSSIASQIHPLTLRFRDEALEDEIRDERLDGDTTAFRAVGAGFFFSLYFFWWVLHPSELERVLYAVFGSLIIYAAREMLRGQAHAHDRYQMVILCVAFTLKFRWRITRLYAAQPLVLADRSPSILACIHIAICLAMHLDHFHLWTRCLVTATLVLLEIPDTMPTVAITALLGNFFGYLIERMIRTSFLRHRAAAQDRVSQLEGEKERLEYATHSMGPALWQRVGARFSWPTGRRAPRRRYECILLEKRQEHSGSQQAASVTSERGDGSAERGSDVRTRDGSIHLSHWENSGSSGGGSEGSGASGRPGTFAKAATQSAGLPPPERAPPERAPSGSWELVIGVAAVLVSSFVFAYSLRP